MGTIDKNIFAAQYARCGNAYEAAVAAGAGRAQAALAGVRLLCEKAVRRRVEQHRLDGSGAQAVEGLRRIAFGRNNDAVALAFSEEVTPQQIEAADLYGVSEIKCGKGVVEIKFFDRCKALDMLRSAEDELSRSGAAENFLSAVFNSDAGSER